MIFSHWNGKVSVRTQRYRLDDSNRLFDMEADPGQDHDISAAATRGERPPVQGPGPMESGPAARLGKRQPPFTVGYPQFPITQLPARDGVPHGNVQRSANAPNCSYFKNWTSTNDSITWDIEVATAGKYEAVIYYTCPAADIGSTIELSFQGSRLQAKVSEANDPPLRGAENDRVPRQGESYVKDFKPLRLGDLRTDQRPRPADPPRACPSPASRSWTCGR